MGTAYFLGAGASKADNFPLTRELLGAIGAYLYPKPGKTSGKELREFLTTVFGVEPKDLRTAASQWRRLVGSKSKARGSRRSARPEVYMPPEQLPDLTDVLSALDILLAEQSSIGSAKDSKRALKGSTLLRARSQIVQAIAQGFRRLHQVRTDQNEESPMVVEDFIRSISGSDVLITTNWDILLDCARNRRFGTTEGDYGSDPKLEHDKRSKKQFWADPVHIALKDAGYKKPKYEPKEDDRPKLFKLHGSLNWLYCPRCTLLYIYVENVKAHQGHPSGTVKRKGKTWQCECKAGLDAVLVTPTFVKSYRNRHLLNIWSSAQRALAASDRWVFVGYSLPDDDIHIKTLLLKAKRMRFDAGKSVRVAVVTERSKPEIEFRFRRLFGDCDFMTHGFERDIVKRLVRARKKKNKERIKKALKKAKAEEEKRERQQAKKAARRKRDAARRRKIKRILANRST